MRPLFAVSQTLTYRFCVDVSILFLFSYPALTYYTVLQALLLRAFEHSDHLYPGRPDICFLLPHVSCCLSKNKEPVLLVQILLELLLQMH